MLYEETADKIASIVEVIAARHGVAARFQASSSLVDGGMTSVAMVELMLAVESEFTLAIPDADLTPSNFSCIANLARLVARLQTERLPRAPLNESPAKTLT